MNERKTFRYFYGLNLHFKNETFNILKYGYDLKAIQTKFDGMSSAQKYQFVWLGNKFKTTEDIVYACIGCIFDGVDMQYGTRDEILKAYYKFKARREGLAYAIKNDHEKREYDDTAVNFEGLIYKYLAKEYCPEYVILNDPDLTQLKSLYQDRNFGFCRDKILYLIKYSQFFNSSKYANIIIKENEHSTI